jgi:anti-sigma B factor antagonist
MMTGNLDVCLRGGHAVAAVRGELDVTSSADVMSAVAALAARHQVVIVELSALDFMDCGALRALLEVQRLARRSGGDVLLAAPAASVRRLLSLTSMGEVFGVHATVDTAVASIARHQESGACRRPERTGHTAPEPLALSRSPG